MEISEKLAGGEDGGSPFSGFPRTSARQIGLGAPFSVATMIDNYDDGEGGGGRRW